VRQINYNLWRPESDSSVLIWMYNNIRLRTEKVGAPESTVIVEKHL